MRTLTKKDMEKANIANETLNEFKKFSLKNVEDFLSDNEMKNTRGGSVATGTCAALNPSGNTCISGLSKVEAWYVAGCEDLEDGTNCHGGFWCCDCCSSAIWYDEYYCN